MFFGVMRFLAECWTPLSLASALDGWKQCNHDLLLQRGFPQFASRWMYLGRRVGMSAGTGIPDVFNPVSFQRNAHLPE